MRKLKQQNRAIQYKSQYNLDKQTAKISALSWGNVSKYEFLTGKDVLPEKNLLEKALKRIEEEDEREDKWEEEDEREIIKSLTQYQKI